MDNFVVTIGRRHGSGGRLIGAEVAKKLGIEFYDKQIIFMTAKKSGLSENFLRDLEDKKPTSFLYDIYMGGGPGNVYEQAFIEQSKIIRELAAKSPCVIVGRCADYLLRDEKNLVKVFVHAPEDECIRRVVDEYRETDDKTAAKFITAKNKARASYYRFYTQFEWGEATNYDLCINSSVGIESSADVICDYVKNKLKI